LREPPSAAKHSIPLVIARSSGNSAATTQASVLFEGVQITVRAGSRVSLPGRIVAPPRGAARDEAATRRTRSRGDPPRAHDHVDATCAMRAGGRRR
jgi:hypothetical protein